jgi:hypothetical protein
VRKGQKLKLTVIYRQLEAFYIRFPSFRSDDPVDRILYPRSEQDQAIEKDGKESLGVILLHLRKSTSAVHFGTAGILRHPWIGKLREGVLASRRMDSFAVKGQL